uniref:Uncharacterized protein n=1 Tax=Avena sativa TaxID=4498 RepID=A0ACD6AAE9_AVESA
MQTLAPHPRRPALSSPLPRVPRNSQKDGRFAPVSALLTSQPHSTGWTAVDCRYGRALFDTCNRESRYGLDLVVLDPVTRHRHRVPWPVARELAFSAAVLCAARGCDHHGCQGGSFQLVFVTTNQVLRATLGWLCSSETRAWSELTYVHHPNVKYHTHNTGVPSVLVGDSLYFNAHGIIQCQLGTLRLSMLEKPTYVDGALMATEDGGLGFSAVVDAVNLTMWTMETRPDDGSRGWAKLRVIDLQDFGISRLADSRVSAFAEGTQVILVSTCVGSYMVDLKSGRARKVSCGYGEQIFPYTRFYIPGLQLSETELAQPNLEPPLSLISSLFALPTLPKSQPSPPLSSPMDELVKDGFLRLSDDLVKEVFFRLPPDEPAWLVRVSAVHKP